MVKRGQSLKLKSSWQCNGSSYSRPDLGRDFHETRKSVNKDDIGHDTDNEGQLWILSICPCPFSDEYIYYHYITSCIHLWQVNIYFSTSSFFLFTKYVIFDYNHFQIVDLWPLLTGLKLWSKSTCVCTLYNLPVWISSHIHQEYRNNGSVNICVLYYVVTVHNLTKIMLYSNIRNSEKSGIKVCCYFFTFVSSDKQRDLKFLLFFSLALPLSASSLETETSMLEPNPARGSREQLMKLL